MSNSNTVRVKLPELTHLGHTEDLESFSNWKFKLEQHLNVIPHWKRFLKATWSTPDVDPYRGLTADPEGTNSLSKEEKLNLLNQMLEFISGYSNTVAMKDEIIQESTSLKDIFYRIQCFYQIQKRETRALEIPQITQKVNERPEALYRRLRRSYMDLLQCKEDRVLYKGKPILVDEQ